MSGANSVFKVVADISGGYNFRCAIEYFFIHRKEGNFIFYPDKIIYNSANQTETVLNDLVYKKSDLQNYVYNGPDNHSIIAGVDISELRTIIRGIAKKDSVQLYIIEGKNELFIKIFSANSKNADKIGQVTLLNNLDATILNPPEFSNGDDKPNKTISSSELNKMCTGLNSLKGDTVTISAFPNGILFYGEGTSTKLNHSFGQVDYSISPELSQNIQQTYRHGAMNSILPPSPQENGGGNLVLNVVPAGLIKRFKVATKTIKSLGKLNNISKDGNVKIYAERDIPMIKFVCNVGSSEGILTVCLRDIEEDALDF